MRTFIGVAIILTSLWITAWGQTKTEKILAARQDSIISADSIAKAETEAEAARIEQARQASIQKAELEKKEFEEAIPSFLEIYMKMNNGGLGGTKVASWLKGKGFTVSSKEVIYHYPPVEETDSNIITTCILKKGKRKCVITNAEGILKVTIDGDPEFLTQYAKDAKQVLAQIRKEIPYDDIFESYSVKRKGNSIILDTYLGD